MAYCTNCGQVIGDARFCGSCGKPLVDLAAAAHQAAPSSWGAADAVPPKALGSDSAALPPKRGGQLAVLGFLLFFVVSLFGIPAGGQQGMGISAFVGFAAIAGTLWFWKSRKLVIKGTVFSWVSLIFLGVVALAAIAPADEPSGASAAAPAAAIVSKEDPKRLLLKEVKLEFRWRKEGFGNVMEADFTIKNPTDYRFKDFEITCMHDAPSGTTIDSNVQTLYQVIAPRSTRRITNVNMGFIHTQALSSGCEITDLVVIK